MSSNSGVFKAFYHFMSPDLNIFSFNVPANESAAVHLYTRCSEDRSNEADIKIIDVSSKEEFVKGHNTGAVNTSAKDICNSEVNTDSLDNLKHISELFSSADIKKRTGSCCI